MKALSLLLVISCFWAAQAFAAPDLQSQPPKECRYPGYTCVLKKVAGGYFWCQKTTRDRIQNARKKIRANRRIRCIKRFPVEEQ